MEPIQVIASFHTITLHPAEPELKNPNRLEEIQNQKNLMSSRVYFYRRDHIYI